VIRRSLAILAALLLAASFLVPIGRAGAAPLRWIGEPLSALAVAAALAAALALVFGAARPLLGGLCGLVGLGVGAAASLALLGRGLELGPAAPGLWLLVLGLALLAWLVMEDLARADAASRLLSLLVPTLFGLALLYLWQVVVVGFAVPPVLLPPPSQIAVQLAGQAATLWNDFRQTFLKAVLAGWAFGCAGGFAVAVLIDRVPFMQRGLLPLGSLVSAVPIVGIAPIMVMWFGFDWQSKAAVIVVMTFFPMLINSLAGFAASDPMSRDLMRSYGASYWQTFFKLRLPGALPFVFNALKINSTLALIGAIVSEFFGSPISGLGFRISVEIGRMNVDVVWATIAVAALAGSLFYGVLAGLERLLTFWHPSYRD
jgi:NitT/TauT family transport system permease protein